MMLIKAITYFGEPMAVVCDMACGKAWGINSRPRIEFDGDDDYAFLADDELGTAPIDPGTYEGGDAKPTRTAQMLNKWCVRECERCHKYGGNAEGLSLRNFGQRVYNQPWKHGDISTSTD